MEFLLNVNLKQELKKENGLNKSKAELYAERIFRVDYVDGKTEVYDYKNDLITILDENITKKIFLTKKTSYPAIFNYETGHFFIVKFISLHGHSSYSILDCISRPEDIADKVDLAAAVTDHGNMFGSLKFYNVMKAAGKKPIIGFEAYTSSLDYIYNTKKGDTLHSVTKKNHISIESLMDSNDQIKMDIPEGKDILKAPELVTIEENQSLLIEKSNAKNHLVLLAKSEKGYKNLVKLTSLGQEKYRRGRPQIDWDDFRKYNEDVVALSACLAGELPRAVLNGNLDQARRIIEEMISIFGKENYYIEIQRHGIDDERVLNPVLMELAEEYDLKVVATSDNHYTHKEDAIAHEAHLCIGTKSQLDDPNHWTFPGGGYHIHSSSEMEDLFSDIPEVLDNTVELMEKLNCVIPTGKLYMPVFPIPEGYADQSAYFETLVRKGFEDRFKGTDKLTNPEYLERLQFEIDTINKMGFPGYFLIVADFVNYAKRNYHLVDNETAKKWRTFISDNNYDPRPISVGPGRGSACGSLVAYAMNITNIDPIPYGLLFERFLNPDRISMPDVDMDFPDTRREEVLEYVRDLYGKEAVSGIVTFGTLGAKIVVRDSARVMGYQTSFGDKIAKAIPDKIEVGDKKLSITLENCIKYDLAFKQLYEMDSDVKKVVDMALRLEGLPRNTSQHACGYLIVPGKVTDYIPQSTVLNKDTKERDTVTQYTMSECEDMGLLKMDFLGLRTMGVIDRSINLANEKRKSNGQELLNINNLSEKAMNDLNVYKFISQGHTSGVFQLESPGMTDLMSKLYQDISKMDVNNLEDAIECFERLVAGISLYRPGPMDEIPNYIKNMLDPTGIVYDSKELKNILSATYNVIVYQEQVMFIVRELAGFTRGQSDTIRKAMGKKKVEIINEYEDYFLHGSKELNIVGCDALGIPIDLAKDIWDRMKKFALYAFNKSHAVGYANIAIMNAYLSFYYATETMCETLNSYKSNADRIKQFIGVCKSRNIEVLPPNVNSSQTNFSVEGNGIRFGFNGLKNMGKSGHLIIHEREQRGSFESLFNFIERMATHQRIDKRMMESLIYSGSLDNFAGTRKEKLAFLPTLLGIATATKESKKEGMVPLFNASAFQSTKEFIITPLSIGEMDLHTKLIKEKSYTGFYVTGHPIDEYTPILSRLNIDSLNKISTFLEVEEETVHSGLDSYQKKEEEIRTKFAGVVQDIEVFITKKGDQMATFNLEDETGVIRCVLFPREYVANSKDLIEGNVLAFDGVVTKGDRGIQYLVSTALTIEELTANTDPKYIQLTLTDTQSIAKKELEEIVSIFNESTQKNMKNSIPIVFLLNGKRFTKRKGKTIFGNGNGASLQKLEWLLGKDNVKFVY